MERLIDNLFVYSVTLSISVFSMMFFSKITHANGPEFSEVDSYTFELSGTKLTIDLPGNLDCEFPVDESVSRVNIYDNNNYNEGNYFHKILFERHWNYRGAIWQNFRQRYASLGLYINLGRGYLNKNLFEDILKLEQLSHLISNDYQFEKIGETTVLKVVPPREKNQPQRHLEAKYIKYYLPIEENHFVVLTFKYYGAGDPKEFKSIWSGKIESDIRKIINSIKIEYAPSVQTRIGSMAAQ